MRYLTLGEVVELHRSIVETSGGAARTSRAKRHRMLAPPLYAAPAWSPRRRIRPRVQRDVRRTRRQPPEVPPPPQDETRVARRRSRSCVICARTAFHSRISTRPSATSRDRRSSSSTHAAATCSSGSSRLANISSVKRARSGRGSRSTAASNSSVDMGSVYASRSSRAYLLVDPPDY